MNWDAIILAGIAGAPATIAALAAFAQASKARAKSEETHLAVNSRMDKMLELVTQGAADKATLAEKKAERTRKGDAAIAASEGRP